jgi:hypothetical protein
VSEPEWIARFWAKVDFDGPIPERRPELGPCHVWTASVNGHHGYGKFWVNGRLLKAHRIALELAGVPIPAGYIVDHLCRNVRCVRLEHLEPVTQRENFLRGDSPTATVIRTNRCKRGHEYTPDITYFTKAGTRMCRLCDVARRPRYHARKMETQRLRRALNKVVSDASDQ